MLLNLGTRSKSFKTKRAGHSSELTMNKRDLEGNLVKCCMLCLLMSYLGPVIHLAGLRPVEQTVDLTCDCFVYF